MPELAGIFRQPFAEQVGSDVPEWVHLLPISAGAIQTGDNRGPYHVDDAQAVIAASFTQSDRLPIDENHATDLASPKGLPAPARGWIVELQARADGIWGRVEWTVVGRDLISSHAYRAISPVLLHDKSKRVIAILRASLVNRPNLRGLTALNHQETDVMSFQATLALALGLDPDASEGDITGAVTTLQGTQNETAALQSQIDGIGTVLGVESGGDILAAAQATSASAGASAGAGGEAFVAMQSELTAATEKLAELDKKGQRDTAEAFIDAAIRDKRVGVSNQRETFISMHMENPSRTEDLVAGFQKLGPSGTTNQPPVFKDGLISLNAEQRQVAAALGVSQDDYAKTLKSEQEATL